MRQRAQEARRSNALESASCGGVHTIARSELYVEMTRSLLEVADREVICLTSFQSSHPFHQDESEEIKNYHDTLERVLKSRPDRVEARRLLAIQTINKLPWLDDVVASLAAR